MINARIYVKFLKKHRLTQAQFMLLYCLHKNELSVLDEYNKLFPADDGSSIGEYWLVDLIKRGYIMKVGRTNTTESYVVTNKFTMAFIDKYDAIDELLEVYPNSITGSDGKVFPLKNVNRDNFAAGYERIIKGSYEDHKEMVKDILYARELDLIKVKIDSFIVNKFYTEIRKERLKTERKGTKSSNEEY